MLGKTEDPLAPYGPNAAGARGPHDAFPHCPDIMVNSTYWADLDEVAAFEELVGSHGGMGGGQAHPFVLAPGDLEWPAEPVIGADAVHRVFRALATARRPRRVSTTGATSVAPVTAARELAAGGR